MQSSLKLNLKANVTGGRLRDPKHASCHKHKGKLIMFRQVKLLDEMILIYLVLIIININSLNIYFY